MVDQKKHINKGAPLTEHEMNKQVALFEIAEDVTDRIDNMIAAAPELFKDNIYHEFEKYHSGEIKIAIRSIVGEETVSRFYAIEDDGIVFTAERSTNGTPVSSVFVATGAWTEKFERLENSIREAYA